MYPGQIVPLHAGVIGSSVPRLPPFNAITFANKHVHGVLDIIMDNLRAGGHSDWGHSVLVSLEYITWPALYIGMAGANIIAM